jgi:hypothetical protein
MRPGFAAAILLLLGATAVLPDAGAPSLFRTARAARVRSASQVHPGKGDFVHYQGLDRGAPWVVHEVVTCGREIAFRLRRGDDEVLAATADVEPIR